MVSTIDPARLSTEFAADADVLRVLRDAGNVPSIPRQVDIRFVGPPDLIHRLSEDLKANGWAIIQIVQFDGEDVALDAGRTQTTEPEALRELTVGALHLEEAYRVRYDGWGSVATAV